MLTVATTGTADIFGDLSMRLILLWEDLIVQPEVFWWVGNDSNNNVIEYVQIMSTGNAVDFGDLTVSRHVGGSCSNVHGGL